jgi:hypothetical protein
VWGRPGADAGQGSGGGAAAGAGIPGSLQRPLAGLARELAWARWAAAGAGRGRPMALVREMAGRGRPRGAPQTRCRPGHGPAGAVPSQLRLNATRLRECHSDVGGAREPEPRRGLGAFEKRGEAPRSARSSALVAGRRRALRLRGRGSSGRSSASVEGGAAGDTLDSTRPGRLCPFRMTTSGALFPSLVPGSRGSSNKYLVEFRAGKMSLKGTTVTPDKRKGLVYIQQTDDSLIHFCWKDRTSGTVEDVSAGPSAP